MFTMIVFVASLLVSAYFASRANAKNTIKAQEFQVTTAEEGSAIPIIHGTVWTGAIVAWNSKPVSRAVETGGGFFGGSTTIGYNYYASVHLVLCLGAIDKIKRIESDSKTIHKGDFSGGILVNRPNLYGDKDGVLGNIYLAINGFPSRVLTQGTTAPMYKGLTSLVYTGSDISLSSFCLGEESSPFKWGMSPNLRTPKYLVQAIDSVNTHLLLEPYKRVRKKSSRTIYNRVFLMIDNTAGIGASSRIQIKAMVRSLLENSFGDTTVGYQYVLTSSRGTGVQIGAYRYDSLQLPSHVLTPSEIDDVLDDVDEFLIGDRQTQWKTSLNGIFSSQLALAVEAGGHPIPPVGAIIKNHFFFITSGFYDYRDIDFNGAAPSFEGEFKLSRDTYKYLRTKSFNSSDASYSFKVMVLSDENTSGNPKINQDQTIKFLNRLYSLDEFIYSNDNASAIYDAVASTGSLDGININPAVMIYDCLTNIFYGAGIPQDSIDIQSFLSCARTLSQEEFGLSLQWSKEGRIFDYIELIRSHIGAVLYEEPTNGLWTLKLIRDDYDRDSLPSFDESNCQSVMGFERQAFSDRVSQINLTYTDIENNTTAFVVVQDSALASATGKIVSKSVTYEGITTPEIASKIALRDLKQASTGLASLQIRIPYSKARSLRQGDVFKLSWSEYKMLNVIMRISELDLGDSKSGLVTVSCVQDVFSLPKKGVTTEDTNFSDSDENIFYTPEYLGIPLSFSMSNDGSSEEVGEDWGVFAKKTENDDDSSTMYKVYKMEGSEVIQPEHGMQDLNFGAYLAEDLKISNTSAVFSQDVIPDTYMIVGSSGYDLTTQSHELIKIGSKVGENKYSITRGCDDTVPMNHSAGTTAFTYSRNFVRGKELISDVVDQTTEYMVINSNGFEQDNFWRFDSKSAILLNSRYTRPLPPRNVLFNGLSFPDQVLGDVSITFTKSKEKAFGDFSGWGDNQDVFEDGVTYGIKAFVGGSEILSLSGISDDFVSIPEQDLLEGDLTLEISSYKGSLGSYMPVSHTMAYTKVNMRLDASMGSRQITGVTNELSSVTINVDESLSANFTPESAGTNTIQGKAEAGATITIEVED